MTTSSPWLAPFLELCAYGCRQRTWPDEGDRNHYQDFFKTSLITPSITPSRADGCNFVTSLGPHGMQIQRLADFARMAEFYNHAQVAQVCWECVFVGRFPQSLGLDESLLVPAYAQVVRQAPATAARVVLVFPLRTIIWSHHDQPAWNRYDARAQALAGAACAYGPFQAVIRQDPAAPKIWMLTGAYRQCEEGEVSEIAAAEFAQHLVAYANTQLRRPDPWHPRGEDTSYRCRSVSLADIVSDIQ